MTVAKTTSWIAICALILASGCYFLRYDALCRTHVEVLTAMAEKRRDLIVAGVAGRDTGEFRYPLERGRDFLRIVAGRFGERDSYRRLVVLLDRYERGLGESASEEVETTATEIGGLGRAVVEALDAESA